MKKGLALLLTGLLAVTSIPAAAVDIGEVDMTKGTTDWNNPESYVYNNDTGVPDKGLYEAVVSDGGGSDGLLTVAEAEVMYAFAKNSFTTTTINSLKGLEHFKSLQSIWIYNDPESDSYAGGITDLSPLKDLKSLGELQLFGNPELTDLSPLENLDSLYALYLRDAVKIQDFSPLKNTNIARLDIRGTNSTHPSLHDSTNLFDTVKQMGRLYWLELTGFVISDADSMLELPGLSALGLWDCEFESKLPQLPNLENLYIRDSNLTNLNGIERLPKLNILYLTKNKQLTTLDGIEKLPKLNSLFFEENKQLTTLPDLSGSSELTLESLHFSNNQLSAEELTAKLPKRLQELPEWPEWLKRSADKANSEIDMTKGTTDWNSPESYVYNNDTGIPDKALYKAAVRWGDEDGLLTVAEAKRITYIYYEMYDYDYYVDSVNSLKGLEHFESLNSLWIGNNTKAESFAGGITDLSPLKDLEHFGWLHLSGNPELTDLSPLTEMDLGVLSLFKFGEIRDFSPLKKQKRLSSLQLSENLEYYEYVYLPSSSVSAQPLSAYVNLVSALQGMPALDGLQLVGLVIPDAAPLFELPHLENLKLTHCRLEKVSEILKPAPIEVLSLGVLNTTPDISWLPQLTNLNSLSIWDSNLTNLNGIEKLSKLSDLSVYDNGNLTTLPDLSGLSNLTLENLYFSNNRLSAEELTAKLPKHFQELSEWPEWLKDNADDVEDVPESILPKPGAQEDGSYVVNLDQPDQNDGHRFSVNLPEGMVDESKGLTLKVTPQTTSSAAVKAEAEKENCEIQHGFDLSLEYADGTKVEYTPGKLMTVSIYSLEIVPGRAYRIFRENDDGSVDVIIPSYVGHGIMQFKTDHFSHYSWGIVKNAPVVPDRPSRPSGSSGGSYSYSSRIDENWIFVRSQGMGSVTPGDCTVYDGEDKTFTFMPDEGYKVGKVLLDGEEIPTDGKSYTLRDITAPHTLTVIFARDTADEASKPVDPVKPNVTENAQTGDAWWKLW